MKIEVTKKNILPVLKICADIAPTNPHLPSLIGGVLSAGDGGAFLYSTDLEVFCTVSFPAEIAGPGRTVVPLKKLASLIDRLDGDPVIQLNTENEFQTRIRSGGTDTRLAGFDPEAYPTPPESESVVTVEIPAKKFLNAVQRVAYAASKDPTQFVYQGLWFERLNGQLSMTCCDMYKLATENVSWEQGQGVDFKVNLPLRACMLMTKWISESGKDFVRVEIGGDYVRFTKEPAVVVTRVLGLEVPDWRKVIPADAEVRVKSPVEEITAAVERIAVVTDEKWFAAEVNILPGQVVMKSETPVGTAKETLNVETEGSTVIHLNVPFLLQTLKAVGKGNVEILFPCGNSGKLHPVVFRFDAAPEHLAILQPVVINNK